MSDVLNELGITKEPAHVFKVHITPEQAKALLALNYEGQRNVRASNVSKLVAQINRGEWNPYVGDVVRITPDGILIDGQHRLRACVESGKAIDLLMCMECTVKDFVYIDQGLSRRASDAFGATPNRVPLTASLKIIMGWEKWGLRDYRMFQGVFDSAAMWERYEEMGESEAQRIVREAQSIRKTAFNKRGGQGAIALFIFLAEKVDMAKKEEFCRRLKDPNDMGLLKNSVLVHQGEAGMTGKGMLNLLCKSWNAFLEQRTLKQLKPSVGELTMLGVNKMWHGIEIEKQFRESEAN